MDSRRLTDRLHTGWLALSSSIWVVALSSGVLIGVLAVSTWLSWTLTWSDDRALACAAILMFAGGIVVGGRVPLSRHLNQGELAVAACTWTLLQPWLTAGLAWSIRYLPPAWLESEQSRLLVGLVCAVPTWFAAGWLWSGLVIANAQLVGTRRGGDSTLAAGLAFGLAIGLAGSVFVMAPWIGAWGTVAVAVLVVILARIAAESGQPNPEAKESTSSASFPASAAVAQLFGNAAVQAMSAVAIGGLLAVVMRLVGQLMPNGSQVYFAEWIGVAVGFGLGQCLCGRQWAWMMRGPWVMLAAAATGALLLALLPAIISASLWTTATVTSSALLMAFRVLLLASTTAPAGLALAGLMPVSRTPFGRSVFPLLLPLPLAVGFIGTQFCFQTAGLVGMLTIVSVSLVLMGLLSLFLPGRETPSWRGWSGITCCALLGLSVPIWSTHDNPSQTAKLLFSTPAFVAHRAGWDSRLLPVLDDARAIDQREGLRGPLTLWRSHGLELHLRDNGMPRSVISANTLSYPQFAPEVLQAVFPLIMVQHPNQILLLGASSGVPLATCLKFPVQHVVCAENDQSLIDLIRGPIAQETGYDPFTDERTHAAKVPPAIAVMSRRATFDVILSSPPSSSIVAGGAMYTADHYRNASRCLTAGGIFCQRFECLDYGPELLRMVVQAMRQGFDEVIAIETAAGEFLLLGTNSADSFVHEDLPVRLEAAHVRRLLAQSGLDWSTLLNLPAYDHAALGEICAEGRTWTNSPANGILALRAPLELMRWGAKQQEAQSVLTALRTSPAPFLNGDRESQLAAGELKLPRRSRLLEWLGDERVSPVLLRRLSEVAAQMKLVQENPESHWWEYRKTLRQQLQNRTGSTVQQVSHAGDDAPVHPEDERRKQYFIALGAAAQQRQPTVDQIRAIAAHLQPYDPLISYFARQEIADLQARGQVDSAWEFVNRLHVIYFANAGDASTRNVAAALELLVQHPEAVPDPAHRFDTLNGLIQTLRTRWELRQSHPVKSARRQLSDIDRSVVAVEKGVQSMDGLYAEARIADADWENRKQVIDRILLRPLRGYRSQLQASALRSEGRTQAAIKALSERDDDEGDAGHAQHTGNGLKVPQSEK